MNPLKFPRFNFITRLLSVQGEVYLVGGTVRDILMGLPHKDYDLLVRGLPPEELVKTLKPLGYIKEVGKSFGVFKFRPNEFSEFEFDIALPRVEKSTGVGHRDFQVDFNHLLTAEEDLGRRDFTLNAMAYNLQTETLVDPFDGKKDLEQKILRQVFPKAFEEDPLRLLRAVQFAARFSLTIEPNTLNAMKEHAEKIKTVSRERIIIEVQKLMTAPKPSHGFDIMRNTGILEHIFPFVKKMIGVLQPMKQNEDVYLHTMKVLDAARNSSEMEHPGEMEMMFSALLHDAGKPQTHRIDPKTGKTTFYAHQIVSKKIARRWLEEYKASTIGLNVDQVLSLVEHHMFETKSFYSEKAIRRFVSKIGQDSIFKLIDLRIADKKGGRYPDSMKGILKLRDVIRAEINKKPPFGPKDLAINGHEIMTLGFKPGPIIGKIQAFLMEKVLDEPGLNEKEKLIQLIKENFSVIPA